jgi:hypothetical protein
MVRDTPGSSAFDHLAILRLRGLGRFFDIPFLGVWLVFWAIAESFALVMFAGLLVSFVYAVLGLPAPAFAPKAPDFPFGAFVLTFLFVWLALWTLGGYAALTQFSRSLLGEDRIALTPDGLEITRRVGPFGRSTVIPREVLRGVRLRAHDRAVVLDTSTGVRDVTRFGTPAEREQVRVWLRQRLPWPDPLHAARVDAETAPPGWVVQMEGADALLTQTSRRIWGRPEWIVRGDRLMFRRRVVGAWTTSERAFEQAVLELTSHTDSDGDAHFALHVRTPTAKKKIAATFYDGYEVERLAGWIAARTRFRIDGL